MNLGYAVFPGNCWNYIVYKYISVRLLMYVEYRNIVLGKSIHFSSVSPDDSHWRSLLRFMWGASLSHPKPAIIKAGTCHHNILQMQRKSRNTVTRTDKRGVAQQCVCKDISLKEEHSTGCVERLEVHITPANTHPSVTICTGQGHYLSLKTLLWLEGLHHLPGGGQCLSSDTAAERKGCSAHLRL